MKQNTFDISLDRVHKIACPNCDYEFEHFVGKATHEIIQCENDHFTCGQPFVLSIITMSNTVPERKAYVECLKIETREGPIAKIMRV